MTDGNLVCRARAGDSAAYGQLCRRWAGHVLAVCHARVGRWAAEDLAQEALLRGLRGLNTLSDPEKFGSWVTGIAIRTCLDWLKSSQRSEVSLDANSANGAEASASVWATRPDTAAAIRAERSEALRLEVERLPPTYREVVMLYYYQDCTYQDLADALGVSAATINARLTKARSMLRAAMLTERE